MSDFDIAKALWDLLDKIDTVPDALRPNDCKSHEQAWRHMVSIAEKRHDYLQTDGYSLMRRRGMNGLTH